MKSEINRLFNALAQIFDGDNNWQTFVMMERGLERRHRDYVSSYTTRAQKWNLTKAEMVRLMCVRNILRARLGIGRPDASDFFTLSHTVFAAYALYHVKAPAIVAIFGGDIPTAHKLLKEIEMIPS